MKTSAIVQIIISLLSLFIGYPNGGSVFIIIIVPLVAYLVLSKKGDYFPALMIHCASGTSIIYVIFILMMVVCLINYREIARYKLLNLYCILLLVFLPFYLYLTCQRYALDGDTIFGAFGYSSYYLCFWGGVYCFLISKSICFKPQYLFYIILSLFLYWLITDIKGSYTRLAYAPLYIVQSFCVYFFVKNKNLLWIAILVITFPLMFANEHSVTFTELGISLLTILLTYTSVKNNHTISRWLSGPIVFIAISVLIIYGASVYSSMDIIATETGVDFSSKQEFVNRFWFKLFSDRAPFWNSAIQQLFVVQPWLPKHDMPELFTIKADGCEVDNSVFGGHCSPLELMRKFGIIMGVVLIFIYISMTIESSKYLQKRKADDLWLPLYCASVSSTIMYFLTGTTGMVLYYCLFTFGIQGITFYKLNNEI